VTIPEHLDRVREAHDRATDLRAQADAASDDVKRAVARAVDDDVLVPELATELDLSVVRVYQLARQGRDLLTDETTEE